MPIMRVLAASFPDGDSARAARAQLIRAFKLEDTQISVEALAAQGTRGNRVILAGHFEESVAAAARASVEQFGGTLVVDIDDQAGNA